MTVKAIKCVQLGVIMTDKALKYVQLGVIMTDKAIKCFKVYSPITYTAKSSQNCISKILDGFFKYIKSHGPGLLNDHQNFF